MALKKYIPKDILKIYDVHDYRHAACILTNEFPNEFEEICDALREFTFTEAEITAAGGSESGIPKKFSTLLRHRGWNEEKMSVKIQVDEKERPIDSHFVDYCKGRVAFDLEWNSKDQTFDRDLYAFRMFWDYDKISVGILVTRSESLNNLFKKLGIMQKYGASTTWMGKLLPRLDSGRNGGCPVLVFGITPLCVAKENLSKSDSTIKKK
jgi:hypothetical protein